MQRLVLVLFTLITISAIQSRKIGVINNDYAFNMHRTLIAESSNVLTSPLSYLTQLGMLQLVSDGNTDQEIRRSIGYESAVSSLQIQTFYSELVSRLSELKNNFKMANVIVLRQDYPTTGDGEAALKLLYNASVQMYNVYKATETMEATNKLISVATDGIFQRFLISPLDSYNRLAMLNAVYFSGTWKYQFQSVHRDYFYNKGKLNHASLLPMMSIQGQFYFAKLNVYDTEITALELPYKDGDLKMLFLLPNSTELEGLIRIEQQLTADGLSKIVNEMTKKEVKVTIPKFQLQPGHDLMWSVLFLGVRDAFNNAANFHHLSKEKGLFVTKVLHKMELEMNTAGAEESSVLTKADYEFVANRPFLFFVRDTKTEMILFMGRIVSLASR